MNSIKLGTILKMVKGKKPKTQVHSQKDGLMPYCDIKAFETGKIDNYTDGEKCVACDEGDVLIVCDGARSGLVGFAMKGYVGSTLAKLSAEGVDNKYLFYFLQSKYTLLNTNMKGTGTPHVNQAILKDSYIYVPSIDEQQRIVARIEELFSELNQAEETLLKTKEQLEVYRQAVLSETLDRDDFQYISLKEIIEKPRYGTSKKCTTEKEENSKFVIRIPNIDWQSGVINKEDSKYACFTEKEFDSISLKENDLLVIRSNGSPSLVGRCAIVVRQDTDNTYAGYLIRIRLKEANEINARFLWHTMNSPKTRSYIEKIAKSTSGVNNVNAVEIGNLPVAILDYESKKKIVDNIDNKLSAFAGIERDVEVAINKGKSLRQSILKEAFEGKLV